MKILTADYILTCNDKFEIIKNGAICFDEKIIEIGKKEEVIKNNPYARVKKLSPNSVIMPGLVNTHVHLEFSANKTTLAYGNFIKWLKSIIEKRDMLKKSCDNECYELAIETMLKSGTLAFGAVSSFGDDMEVCFEAPQKVVYFNEILGSNPDKIEEIKFEFEKRVQKSLKYVSDSFIPALSVHAPYSTHPVLAKYVVDLAKRDNLTVSTHFMESMSEREWLDSARGDFEEFLSFFSKNAKPMYDNALEYLEIFKECKTTFVHANCCNDTEYEKIANMKGSISHCLVSNRVLNNPVLNLKKVISHNIPLCIGTDGLSSNISLNMWDELRSALFAHMNFDILRLAKYLVQAATKNGAYALGLEDIGYLKEGKKADIITVVLPGHVEDAEQLPLELILHTKEIKRRYINGERYV